MIGTQADELISGFETPAIDARTANVGAVRRNDSDEKKAEIAKRRQDVAAAVEVAQTAVVDKVHAVKLGQRKRKGDLERTKDQKMSDTDDEKQRQSYLFNTFVPELRKIGLSKALLESELRAVGPDVLSKFRIAVKKLNIPGCNVDGFKLEWKKKDEHYEFVLTAVGTPFVLLRLFKGAEGYAVAIPAGQGGCVRAVYSKKLGKLSDKGDFKSVEANQYVKDDNGFFTRRWAWGYKTVGACKALMGDIGALRGKYVVAGKDIKAIDEDLRGMYKFPVDKKTLTKEEVLFVNQEKGSGDQQRGVCLSSSPNKTIHGNKGETFKRDKDSDKDNILIKVDLAKVPTGGELLFNLYTQEAQKVTIGLDGYKPTKGGKKEFKADWSKNHSDTSTAKNREIYLRELTKGEVANADHVAEEILRLA